MMYHVCNFILCVCVCVIGTFAFDHKNISSKDVRPYTDIYGFTNADPQVSTGLYKDIYCPQ